MSRDPHNTGTSFWDEIPNSAALRPLTDVLELAIAGSPFLRTLSLQHPDVLLQYLEQGPDRLVAACIEACNEAAVADDSSSAMKILRYQRKRVALGIALADLSASWTTEKVTHALTEFADAAVQAAVKHLLLQAQRQGKITKSDDTGCGYVVLAMGKHGAFELNYSSDIDLIILFDAETAPLSPDIEPSTFFVRLTRILVAILQDVNEDGYVFRVDLRLRPDPRATQVAIAVEAAAVYYENLGQNWERAAMIKARPVAGDIALGREFLDRLKPYIWRRYLDFAAVADIQSLKRQIHVVKGHGEIAIEGHNLKLGRGGIREIEFFVQTQQLIAGGRNPALRGQRTVDMLDALAIAGWVTSEASTELKSSYWFLRTLEHRVQMQNDQQDHCLPSSSEKMETFANFAGFATRKDLANALQATLQTVQRHYQALFESSEGLGAEGGSLVFTGGEDDPDTIETLHNMGFKSPSEVSATIRGWHFGRSNATRSRQSRELLTELMPKLLSALAGTGDADHAFIAFDMFLQGLPAGIQLLSMLKSNPHLLDLIARTMGVAPRLARQLSHQPRTLEAVLDRDFFGPLPTLSALMVSAQAMLEPGLDLETTMDRLRMFAREQMFRVGMRILTETVNAGDAGSGYSNVAETVLNILHAAVQNEIETRHGTLPGSACAIIAMGKLGGREMTATSDLDLIVVYNCTDETASSNGSRPLSVQQYYARFTQRLLAAIVSPTAEGKLFEVDMRLRPSGSKGPVAVSLESFIAYQQSEAWTWEDMALTRARVISATPGFGEILASTISHALGKQRDTAKTLGDIISMRSLMLNEQKPTSIWDIKRKRGGLVEIEFIVQALQLINARERPQVLSTNSREALQNLHAQAFIAVADAHVLANAWVLYSKLTQVLRLSVEGDFVPDTAPKGLIQALQTAAELPDLASVEALLAETAISVAEIFNRLIGTPKTTES